MNVIGISTECCADISAEQAVKYNISVINYSLEIKPGIEMLDTVEISAENVIDYIMSRRGMIKNCYPSVETFAEYFTGLLEEYDEVIHLTVSGTMEKEHGNAVKAAELVSKGGKRVYVVDSGSVSSGYGMLTIRAAMLRDEGLDAKAIIDSVIRLIPKVSVSFITHNADFLYYNGNISRRVKDICSVLHLHPVIHVKNGKLALKKAYTCKYKKAVKRYIKSALREKKIANGIGFVTYAGCSHDFVQSAVSQVKSQYNFEKLIVQRACATTTCNAGPDTVGVIFLKNK